MPIGTYQCPACGARINYTVELGNHGIQVVTCPRCHAEEEIEFSSLPERLQLTVSELEENNGRFKQDMTDSFDDGDKEHDEVGKTIDKVETAFQAAKNVLSIFDDKLDIDTDINVIAEEYAPREEPDKAKPRVESAPAVRRDAVKEGTFTRKARQWAQNKASNYAKSKLAQKWGASESEADEIIAIAASIRDASDAGGYQRIAKFMHDNPEFVVNRVAENADTKLARQLMEMIDSGAFAKVVDAALSDIDNA